MSEPTMADFLFVTDTKREANAFGKGRDQDNAILFSPRLKEGESLPKRFRFKRITDYKHLEYIEKNVWYVAKKFTVRNSESCIIEEWERYKEPLLGIRGAKLLKEIVIFLGALGALFLTIEKVIQLFK